MNIVNAKHLVGIVSVIVGMSAITNAHAHAMLRLDGTTPPRYNTSSLKDATFCGPESSYASLKTNRVSIFLHGETINVQWIETVGHSGLFYIDFTTDSNTAFSNEVTQTDNTGIDSNLNLNYTLPDTTCDSCILRMRQDMGNPITGQYVSCADVILVSGNDLTAPANSSNVMAGVSNTDVTLTWSNPTDSDFKSTLVLRSQGALNNTPVLRKDYLPGDSIGNGVVAYKGTAQQFTDSGLQAMTDYTYTVYSYDTSYNYNTGAETTATTDQAVSNPGGGGGGSTTTTTTSSNADSGGGALAMWCLLPLLLTVPRRLSRRS